MNPGSRYKSKSRGGPSREGKLARKPAGKCRPEKTQGKERKRHARSENWTRRTLVVCPVVVGDGGSSSCRRYLVQKCCCWCPYLPTQVPTCPCMYVCMYVCAVRLDSLSRDGEWTCYVDGKEWWSFFCWADLLLPCTHTQRERARTNTK